MLDPQHLRSFQEIARTGSYSAAARRLGYTQPALSYQMRLLEKAIGAPLTARAGRTVRLTPAGQALLRHADQILTAIRVAERDLAHVVGAPAGVLRITSFPGGRATLLADALATLAAEHPAIDVRLGHADPLDATAAVVRGDAELAVTYRYAVEELPSAPAAVRADITSSLRRSPLTSVPLLTDHVHLVLPRAHPLASSAVASLMPFADERFLVGSELFAALLQRAAGPAGFTPRLMPVTDDAAGMLALAARGVGLALLPGLELLAVQREDVAALPLAGWPARHVAVETWPDLLRVPSIAPVVAALHDAAARVIATTAGSGLASRPAASTATAEVLDPHAADDSRRGPWRAAFDVVTSSLPLRAAARTDTGVVISDASGAQQVHTCTRDGTAATQLTAHPGGVALADVSADGAHVWWFADDHGDERGVWMVQPIAGGDPAPAGPDVAPGTPTGLALGAARAAIGRSDRDGSEVFTVELGAGGVATGPARLVYRSDDYAAVGSLSSDGQLVALSHSEHGNSLKPAIRVLRLDDACGEPVHVADLFDGPSRGVWPVAFSPVAASHELLAVHERHGHARPLTWNPVSGTQREVGIQLPGDTTASWYPDGAALLVVHHHRGRSELYRAELDSGSLTRLPTPRGSIAAAAARSDGRVEYLWSSATEPPRVLDAAADTAVELASPQRSGALSDLAVGGSAGDIHALVARPVEHCGEHAGPAPTVFLVHGGPAAHDADAFSPVRNAWLAAGFTTVQVNYRGSTGYGSVWRNANVGRPGITELEDVVAVRDALVADGASDPARLVIHGRSWGGLLALLAVGRHPGLWSLGVANVPVTDTAMVYEDMTDELRAGYRARFGGAPSEVPDAYAAASPLTYVGDVDVPVLISAGLHDPRCPIRQIEQYVAHLAELGKEHEWHADDRGHEARSRAERIDEMAKVLDFTRRHLPPR